ncbi:SEC4 [Symbiodinium necroappetens]|uniref:SEC4 protein n=1 Tax=Symbiodinium necroappetens TaxID=1628268 RepID=A0A812TQB5_9DINO|nr:SEC4 [Symbiodinium necroappetens]
MPVGVLLKRISQQKKTPRSHLSLVYDGKILSSNTLLRDLELVEGDCIHVVRSAGNAYPAWTAGGRIDHCLQCFLLGSPGAGKSVLFRSFCPDHFQDTYSESLGIACRKVFIRTDEEETVQVKFWNVHGVAPRIRTQSCPSLRHRSRSGAGFLVVFNVQNRSTFEDLPALFHESQHVEGGDPAATSHLCLVGNHFGSRARVVSEAEGERLAEVLGCRYYEVSSETGEGLKEVLDAWLDIHFQRIL